jgi:hypothetical protein
VIQNPEKDIRKKFLFFKKRRGRAEKKMGTINLVNNSTNMMKKNRTNKKNLEQNIYLWKSVNLNQCYGSFFMLKIQNRKFEGFISIYCFS